MGSHPDFHGFPSDNIIMDEFYREWVDGLAGVRLLVTGGLLGCGRCLDQLDGQDCDGPWGAGPYRVTGQPIR